MGIIKVVVLRVDSTIPSHSIPSVTSLFLLCCIVDAVS